jgi:2-polyprenyl-3-methyl-5-hydroxy-6-metoxy-1,4-benzoquinol methylase
MAPSGARRRLLVAAVACVLALGVTARAQLSDDEVWKAFLGWLKQAKSLNGPLEALQGFQASVVAQGATPEEGARQLGVVRRLIVERADWWPLLFDSIYKSAKPSFSQLPSTVLVEAVEGRTGGQALDVAMGQGRNAVFLAQRGWTVTGFDLSQAGLEVARANAKAAGVALSAVHSSLETFDYGTARWDLIALIYVPSAAHEGRAMETLTRALKPGGLLVIESFASDRQAAPRRPVDIDPAVLKASLSAFDLLRFDDREAVSEWDPQPTRLCRVIARKR